jgi:hypothetical protein
LTERAPYNPLDKRNLGASVAEALLERVPAPLDSLTKFRGAGMYAIYYIGDFEAYEKIAERNRDSRFEAPIYVGRALPAGARKGAVGLDADPGTAIFDRLREHGKSIDQAENLKNEDFLCRFLAIEDIWIPLGESLLIAKFSPLWNILVDGFGNHDPGKGRYKQLRSRWDVLHPGRAWAIKCQERGETAAQIAAEVAALLQAMPAQQTLSLFDDE